MRKYLIVLAILALPIVSIAQINRQAGIEYLTPLVQSIIHLLQERIAVLQLENQNLKEDLVICRNQVPERSIEEIQRERALKGAEETKSKLEAQALKEKQYKISSLKDKIYEVNIKLASINEQVGRENYEFETRTGTYGFGITASEIAKHNKFITENNFTQSKLESEIRLLQAELERIR